MMIVPLKRGVLEEGAVEGNVVGDAVDDHRVARRPVQVDRAGLHELGLDAFDVARVDVLHQRAGKAVLHAEQNADLFHAAASFECWDLGRVSHPTLAELGWGAQMCAQGCEAPRPRISLRQHFRVGARFPVRVFWVTTERSVSKEICAISASRWARAASRCCNQRGMILARGLDFVFGAIQFLYKAPGGLVALERGHVFAVARLVGGQRSSPSARFRRSARSDFRRPTRRRSAAEASLPDPACTC